MDFRWPSPDSLPGLPDLTPPGARVPDGLEFFDTSTASGLRQRPVPWAFVVAILALLGAGAWFADGFPPEVVKKGGFLVQNLRFILFSSMGFIAAAALLRHLRSASLTLLPASGTLTLHRRHRSLAVVEIEALLLFPSHSTAWDPVSLASRPLPQPRSALLASRRSSKPGEFLYDLLLFDEDPDFLREAGAFLAEKMNVRFVDGSASATAPPAPVAEVVS